MIEWRNSEVGYFRSSFVKINEDLIRELEIKALCNPSGKARICCHLDESSIFHEMIIAHSRNAVVRAHMHNDRLESMLAIKGVAKINMFDRSGGVVESFTMADQGSAKSLNLHDFYVFYRMNDCIAHNLEVLSDVFIFHEATTGPFNPAGTIWL